MPKSKKEPTNHFYNLLLTYLSLYSVFSTANGQAFNPNPECIRPKLSPKVNCYGYAAYVAACESKAPIGNLIKDSVKNKDLAMYPGIIGDVVSGNSNDQLVNGQHVPTEDNTRETLRRMKNDMKSMDPERRHSSRTVKSGNKEESSLTKPLPPGVSEIAVCTSSSLTPILDGYWHAFVRWGNELWTHKSYRSEAQSTPNGPLDENGVETPSGVVVFDKCTVVRSKPPKVESDNHYRGL